VIAMASTQPVFIDAACDPSIIADKAVGALIDEASLTPKPALVDGRGSGAHRDLNLDTMLRSAHSLRPTFLALARAAIGVDDKRGDLLAVENLSFQSVPIEAPVAPDKWDRWRRLLQQYGGALRYVGITLLFLVVYALILRPVKKEALAAFKQIPAQLARPAKGLAADAGGSSLNGIDLPAGSEDAKRAAQLKKQLTEKIKAEPVESSRLVQGWVREQTK